MHGSSSLPGKRAGVTSDDLERELGRRIRAMVAGPVDPPGVRVPVALDEDADGLRPRGISAIGAIGRHVPLVGTQSIAGGLLDRGSRAMDCVPTSGTWRP